MHQSKVIINMVHQMMKDALTLGSVTPVVPKQDCFEKLLKGKKDVLKVKLSGVDKLTPTTNCLTALTNKS